MNFKSEESRKRAVEKLSIGRDMTRKKAAENRRIYEENPNHCSKCGKSLDYSKRIDKFCSRKCSSIYNNNLSGKRGIRKKKDRPSEQCLSCGIVITNNKKNSRKYCSKECRSEHMQKVKFKENLDKYNNGLLSDVNARKFFRKISEKKCSVCELTEWMGKEIPLNVDHIDGDYKNNFPSNLRFVCCNCDAQLPTYKSRNWGRGKGRIIKKTK